MPCSAIGAIWLLISCDFFIDHLVDWFWSHDTGSPQRNCLTKTPIARNPHDCVGSFFFARRFGHIRVALLAARQPADDLTQLVFAACTAGRQTFETRRLDTRRRDGPYRTSRYLDFLSQPPAT